MNLQDIVYPLADIVQWTFGILEGLDNLPNLAFVVAGFAGLAIWLKMQRDYNKEADRTGGLR